MNAKELEKSEFLTKLQQEFAGYFTGRTRTESQWWLALEELASRKYNETRRTEDTAS